MTRIPQSGITHSIPTARKVVWTLPASTTSLLGSVCWRLPFIIFLNISSVLSLLPFWHFNYTCVRVFDIVPQPMSALSVSFLPFSLARVIFRLTSMFGGSFLNRVASTDPTESPTKDLLPPCLYVFTVTISFGAFLHVSVSLPRWPSDGNDNPVCKTEKETQMYRTDSGTLCTEQTSGLCGRKRGWDVLREQHWNKYTIKGETDHQPRLDAWDKCSVRASALGRPRGMGRGGGIGMGNTCKSMADSCQRMAKTTTILWSN